jgi:hypothetical protein
MRPRFHKLNNAISRLLDDYSMVSFHPLDISDEDSLAYVLYTVVGKGGCSTRGGTG